MTKKKKNFSISLYSQKVLFMVRGGCVENMLEEESGLHEEAMNQERT